MANPQLGISVRMIKQDDMVADRDQERLDTCSSTAAAVDFLTYRLMVRPRWRRVLRAIPTYRAYRAAGLGVRPSWRLVLAMVRYRG